MKKYIKDGIILPLNKIVIIKDGFQIFNPSEELLMEDGWLEYVQETQEVLKEGSFYEIFKEINRIKNQLSSSDYKVIKCMEASLCGVELPYDIQALYADRNALRNRINELENSIK